jgi:hypothetical protein
MSEATTVGLAATGFWLLEGKLAVTMREKKSIQKKQNKTTTTNYIKGKKKNKKLFKKVGLCRSLSL